MSKLQVVVQKLKGEERRGALMSEGWLEEEMRNQ